MRGELCFWQIPVLWEFRWSRLPSSWRVKHSWRYLSVFFRAVLPRSQQLRSLSTFFPWPTLCNVLKAGLTGECLQQSLPWHGTCKYCSSTFFFLTPLALIFRNDTWKTEDGGIPVAANIYYSQQAQQVPITSAFSLTSFCCSISLSAPLISPCIIFDGWLLSLTIRQCHW